MTEALAANRFEATASAIGYLHQLRYGLLMALKRIPHGLDWEIAIEAGDDLEVSGPGETTFLQLKHHGSPKTLSDRSVELWKTLRIWASSHADRAASGNIYRLLLVTTATVSDGSIASLLQSEDRDERTALRLLKEIATESNKVNEKAYKQFLQLDDSQLRDLLSKVEIVDSSLDISAVDDELRRVAVFSVSRTNLEAFVSHLEGWWLRRCITRLVEGAGEGISGVDIDDMLEEARERFGPDSLPISSDIFDLEPSLSEYDERSFVRQLHWINIAEPRLRSAIREYLRAFTQRSRWTRDQLVRAGEIEAYEQRLVEAWEVRFEERREELGAEAADSEKVQCARELYKWVEQVASFAIRRGCEDGFITRGSYHMLADSARVGWHVDFEARLLQLLEPSSAGQQ